MDRVDRKAMEHYLPKYTKIAKSPELEVSFWEDTQPPITIECVELKTSDVICAFMNLQSKALFNLTKEHNERKREEAIVRIKRMTFFYDKVKEYEYERYNVSKRTQNIRKMG